MAFTKIMPADTADKGVIGLPNKPNMTTNEIQTRFDQLALEVIIPKHNGLIAELEAGAAGASIGVMNGATETNLQARLDAIAAGGYTKEEADATFETITGASETYLSQASAESTYLAIEDAPTKTSDLDNDSGYITSSSLPTKVSDLTNDAGYITSTALPTKVSDLTNDSGFITSASVDSLTDTNISSPSDGQVLKYDSASSKWVNGTGGGGGASDLDDLSDVAISSVSNGQVLAYDSTSSKWENTTLEKRLNATISSGTTLSFTDSSILSTSVLDLYIDTDSNTPANYDSVTVTSGSGATFILSEAVTSSTTFLLIVR